MDIRLNSFLSQSFNAILQVFSWYWDKFFTSIKLDLKLNIFTNNSQNLNLMGR